MFEEGSGAAGAAENRLANFLRVSDNGAGGEEGVGAESSVMSDEEGEGGGLWCVFVGLPLIPIPIPIPAPNVVELVRNVLSSGMGSLELMLNSAAFAGVVQD